MSVLSQCASLLFLLSTASAAWSETASDLLLVISPDAQSYTAQHTVSSEGELIVLKLPSERVSLLARFSGPERQTFSNAHDQNPDQIAIWSGAAVTRYRVSDSNFATPQNDGTFILQAQPANTVVDVDDPDDLITTVAWVLPDNATLLSYVDTRIDSQSGGEYDDNPGHWQTSGNTVSYRQKGGFRRSLSLHIQLEQTGFAGADVCDGVIENSGECVPDTDDDGIPDYRDICLGEPDAPNTPAHVASADDKLGCNDAVSIVLSGVRFQSGQSYLDVASRDVLDRVALALQHLPERLFEVSAHTDNAGRVATNQRLSENRADAVRHYLMLRGVSPNQLNARGYGEISPVYDNRKAAGRRANRRIELRRLN